MVLMRASLGSLAKFGNLRGSPVLENADTSGIRAESKDGVLTVHIPKTKTERSKAMEIKVQ